MSAMSRIGSPCPRPPGSFEASSVNTLPSLVSTRIFDVVSAKNEVLSASSPLKVAGREIGDLAFQRADPALLRHDDRHRLALDHRLGEVGDHDVGRGLETGAPLAELGVRAELLFDVADLDRDHLPLLPVAREQRLDRGLLFREVVLFLAQRHFLEAAQASQARVEDVDDLLVGEAEAELSAPPSGPPPRGRCGSPRRD